MQQSTNIIILGQVPEEADTTKSYLFYLHGLIVEEAGIRPKSEEHGYYEYQLILEALAGKDFVVISEARPQGTQIRPYADKVASQVRQLLAIGVPQGNIIIVGASKGGAIAAYVSSILRQKGINYVFLSGLFEKHLRDEDLKLYGNVLSIHDRSDKLSITPALYFQRSAGLGNFKEIVLALDLGHGIIYRPYPQWIEPILQWLEAGPPEAHSALA